MTAADAFSLTEGALFHTHYEVVRRIDSGAMGVVYEVLDRRTRRRRALKVMLARFADNDVVRRRFEREATITAEVVSDHIVETFDAGVDAETELPFLVMELLRGEDLGKRVARGTLSPDEVTTLLMQAAGALDRTHAAGVVHRDLKPENLYITLRDNGTPHVKILDFGIAKMVERNVVNATSTRNLGTPVYMSPEQVMGEGTVGPPADLYSLGHIAYTLLVGEPYWLIEALSYDTVYPLLLRIMEGAVEAPSVRARERNITLPVTFDAWFMKATAVAPGDRFPNAIEAIQALADALDVARPPLPTLDLVVLRQNLPTAPAPPIIRDADDDDTVSHHDDTGPTDPGPMARPFDSDPPPAGPWSEGRPSAEPIPLVPTPKPRTAREEALRTLSPVSTLPELRPAPRKSRRWPLALLGVAFFGTGAAITAYFVRKSAEAPIANAGPTNNDVHESPVLSVSASEVSPILPSTSIPIAPTAEPSSTDLSPAPTSTAVVPVSATAKSPTTRTRTVRTAPSASLAPTGKKYDPHDDPADGL